jgi:hypothetical protein
MTTVRLKTSDGTETALPFEAVQILRGGLRGDAREFFDKLTSHATGGVRVNLMPEAEARRVPEGAYGSNFRRLPLKTKYDPDKG